MKTRKKASLLSRFTTFMKFGKVVFIETRSVNPTVNYSYFVNLPKWWVVGNDYPNAVQLLIEDHRITIIPKKLKGHRDLPRRP